MTGKMTEKPQGSSSVSKQELIKAAEKLPPFPAVIWKVTALLRRMAPVSEIEAVIQYDQAIASKVLALSRSAFYARRHAVNSLRDAIVVLGDEQLTRIVMTACAGRYFQSEISGYDLREGQLWKHSVATAILAERAAKRLGDKRGLTVYTAGLLHDIGKAVMSFYVKTSIDAVLILMGRKGLSLLEAEEETLGMNHQQLGMMLAKRWRFPPEVSSGIGFHHCPTLVDGHRDVAAAVYVANKAATALGFGCGLENLVESHEEDILAMIGVSAETIPQFWNDMAEASVDIDRVINREGQGSGDEAKENAVGVGKGSC